MKVENHILEIPIFGESEEENDVAVFDLMIPEQAEDAVKLLIGVITDLVTDIEALDETNYLRASN